MIEICPTIDSLRAKLQQIKSELGLNTLFLIVDAQVRTLWSEAISSIAADGVIEVDAKEDNKTIYTATELWTTMQDMNITRSSLVVNIGGGFTTDIGGFVAATFKRGVRFVNVPTTVLAAVDASSGGKTGVNHNGLKNQLGVFADAVVSLFCAEFLSSLPGKEILSGYAEMVKHGLLSGKELLLDTLNFDLNTCPKYILDSLIIRNVAYKQAIVQQDPKERGLRKSLNLGHTIGHAIEMFLQRQDRSVPHGYAVMWGLIGEMYISHLQLGFPSNQFSQIVRIVKDYYGSCPVKCSDYDEIIAIMRHDKKNMHSEINFTLLADVGKVYINQSASVETIKEAIDFIREN